MELTTIAKEKLGTDEVKMKIALELGKSYLTMRRWIIKGHDNMTKKKTIQAITKHTGLTEDEIFEA
jgi:hypothetical protein